MPMQQQFKQKLSGEAKKESKILLVPAVQAEVPPVVLWVSVHLAVIIQKIAEALGN